MLARLVLGTLGCVALLQAGCGRSGAGKTVAPKPVAAGAQTITLHVEGMAEQLNLF